MDIEKARQQDELLFAAVGKLTVAWARLEFGLDAMILLIHKTMDGAKHEVPLPRTLSSKISYLRAAFVRLGIPDASKPSYDAFLDQVDAGSVTRHDIVHGFPIHHPSDEGEARVVRLIIEKSGWGEQKPVTISKTSVDAAWMEADVLFQKATRWTILMLDGYEAHLKQGSDELSTLMGKTDPP
ncbi:MAG: hypothetical protein ABIY37_01315 [Devosia sp.]